jgi:ureidoacrylate peracid hydrolase
MIPRLKELCTHARTLGIPVIFVRTTHDETTSSSAWLRRKDQVGGERFACCISNTWGAEFYEVQPAPQDVVVTKHRYSAFIGTNLRQILTAKMRDRLILTGVATNVCIESTARDGLMFDYHIVMVSDCTATTDDAAQLASEGNIRQNFGWVASAADILKAWDIGPGRKRSAYI